MTTRLLSRLAAPAAVLALAALAPSPARAQRAVRPVGARAQAPVDPALYSGLTWRNVGPFRAGRVAAVSGAIGQPGVFYIGLPAGGVWKTTSAGETWFPVFDAVKTVSSVGAVEVAPSNPAVVYVGTGDMITGGAINEGDGVYKSMDAGRTWQHLGLEATKQIPSILVDPRDPNTVLVAGQGNVHEKSAERGVFRSTDGGRTWSKTLYVDDQTGIQKLARAYDVPDVIFATTDRHYFPPGAPPFYRQAADTGRTGTSVWKSTDNGVTWQELTGGGLPRLVGRTSIAVAMHTNAQRVFLIANPGLFRSDDGGTSWRRMDPEDERIRNGQGGYNCGVYVDPQNPDVVYTINTASYISRDGGNSFTGFKGAPGGDDPQQMWIDPSNGQRILLGLDQGAVVSLDGGANWSSWYNQSTEQVYHLSTDASFPYWIYATQQDAGAVATRSRGNLGAVTPLDWKPVPGWEWGSIVADPLHPDTVYASGNGIVKISYPDEQWINVSPAQDPALKLRVSQSQPLAWAPWDQRELLAGFQYLMATTDGGVHWRQLSPDLTIVPGVSVAAGAGGSAAAAPMPPPAATGSIESISPSTAAAGTIWVGTTTGRVQLTRDGGRSWSDVSIPGLPNAARALVESVEASHQDPAEAYVAVDLARLGDYSPYLFRTRDYGRTWTKITTGLPETSPGGAFARVLRSDTRRAGLLFAGTESSVWVSFDDGDHWQSLALNLPTTSYRDIAIHGNDLVVGTYGRGIWVLDDISALRQATPAVAAQPAYLFKPGEAVRLRRNVNADTPYPPEVPHALNPLDGVIVDYWLANAPKGEITLEVLDATGNRVRHYSSIPAAPVAEAAQPPEPSFWLATPQALPTAAGLNRVAWDLRYDAPPAFSHTFEINANPGLTPPSPEGALALPGTYTLRLTVGGHAYTQTATVRPDPRSRATPAQLEAQHALLMKLQAGLQAAWQDQQQATSLRGAIANAASHAGAEAAAAAAALEAAIDSVAGNPHGPGRFGGRGGVEPPPSFVGVSNALVEQLNAQDNGDLAPTPAALAGWGRSCRDLHSAVERWEALRTTGLAQLDDQLAHAGVARVPTPPSGPAAPTCQ